jgi:hypothetical protein
LELSAEFGAKLLAKGDSGRLFSVINIDGFAKIPKSSLSLAGRGLPAYGGAEGDQGLARRRRIKVRVNKMGF